MSYFRFPPSPFSNYFRQTSLLQNLGGENRETTIEEPWKSFFASMRLAYNVPVYEFAGFMCGSKVLDKDGVSAAVVAAEMICEVYESGKMLTEQLEHIYTM